MVKLSEEPKDNAKSNGIFSLILNQQKGLNVPSLLEIDM